MDAILQWDGNVLLWIQDYVRQDWLTPIMEFFSCLGDSGFFWILLALLLICFPKSRQVGFYTILSVAVCFVVNNLILKNLVDRIRPYEVVEGLQRLVPALSDASFPSGHACSSFAAAYVLCRSYPKAGWLAYVVAVLIALSRLYVGVHYPTDVLVGALVGTVGSWAAYRQCRKKNLFAAEELRW